MLVGCDYVRSLLSCKFVLLFSRLSKKKKDEGACVRARCDGGSSSSSSENIIRLRRNPKRKKEIK